MPTQPRPHPPVRTGQRSPALPDSRSGKAHLSKLGRVWARSGGDPPTPRSAILALVRGRAPNTPAALPVGAPTLRASVAGADVAIAHLSIRAQSRSSGQSFARSLAYRCGLRLVDCHTRRSHDYTRRDRREEIEHTGLGRFDGLDPSWSLETLEQAQELADRIDRAETRRNSTVARDIECAIPHELPKTRRCALAEDFADWLSKRYRCPVPFAIHSPPADGDARNWHIHALVPDRAVEEKHKDRAIEEKHENEDEDEDDPSPTITMGKKDRAIEEKREDEDEDDPSPAITMGKKLRLFNIPHGREEVRDVRQAWEEHVNRHLAAAGIEERIDMGRTRPADKPSVHLGPRRTGRERRRQARYHAHETRRARLIGDDRYRPGPKGRGVLARVVETQSLDQVAVVAYIAAGEQHETPPGALKPDTPAPELPAPRQRRRRRPETPGAAPERAEAHVPAREARAPRKRRPRRHREPLARAPALLEPQTLTRAPRPPRQRPKRQREPLARAPDPSQRQHAARTIEPAPELPSPTRQRRRRRREPMARAPERVETHAPALDTPAPRQRRRRPHTAPTPAPDLTTNPTPEPPSARPQRRKRRRERMNQAPTATRHQSAKRALERLELLEATANTPERREVALTELEDLAEEWTEPEAEDVVRTTPLPPAAAQVQAHADGHGRPVPSTPTDPETALKQTIVKAVAAKGERLRLAVAEGGAAKGEELIRTHAGEQVPYTHSPMDDDMAAHLEPHVAQFRVARMTGRELRGFGFGRRWTAHKANVQTAIQRWRDHWGEHGPTITQHILTAVWGKQRRDDYAAEKRKAIEENREASAARARWEREQAEAAQRPHLEQAPDRSTWPGRDDGGIGS